MHIHDILIKFLKVVENDDQDRILFMKKIGNLKKDNVNLQVTKQYCDLPRYKTMKNHTLYIREKLRVLNCIVVRIVDGQERIIPEGEGEGGK